MAATPYLGPDELASFAREGYAILASPMPAAELAALRDECDAGLAAMQESMARSGTNVFELNHPGRRYFVPFRAAVSARLREFLFGDLAASLCRELVGRDAWLFLDQFVIKEGGKGLEFSWHQDSGYVPFPHRPYVTFWCALDDMTPTNGALEVLPFSRFPDTGVPPHTWTENRDLVGYTGDAQGLTLPVPAGTIIAFSSHLFHRSGPNVSAARRRAFLMEFTPEPLVDPETRRPLYLAARSLRDGHAIPPADIDAGELLPRGTGVWGTSEGVRLDEATA